MNSPNIPSRDKAAQLKALLQSGGSHSRHYRRWLVSAGIIILLLIVAYFLLRDHNDANLPQYRTQQASMGTLVVKVSATGKLQPTNEVEVGSELSGIVEAVYVDDNDHVKKGQVLAKLDLSKLNDAVTKSRANLASAKAKVLQAQATLAEAKATMTRYQQVSELSGGKVPSKSEMDAAEASLKRAEADKASALAEVEQAKASLKSDETNLAKAHIRSPIDGIVLSRAVEPGQTVAASYQTPVLFTLAEDLSKMELQVDVDEADVGQVKAGQLATFTVDAWPGRHYSAVITRVSYGSKTTDDVVSYPAVLQVENTDLSLRPGMTGTAEITTLTHKNVLLVPNAALRFTPPTTATEQRSNNRSPLSALMPRPRSTPKKLQTQKIDENGMQRIWVLRDGKAVPLQVKVGATNGRVTEILGGELKAGMAVITESLSSRQ